MAPNPSRQETAGPSPSEARPTRAAPAPPIQDPVDALYEKCAQAPKGTVFFQRELFAMGVVDTLAELIALLQQLTSKNLMKVMTFDNEPCWKLRSREEAHKLCTLSLEERTVFNYIDAAQAEGIWSKALRARTNFTQQALNKCLKALENKDLVQSVMSVKTPNRKMYLLKHLRPSEDIAGGPWQSDGEFDIALIDTVSRLVEKFIQRDTCVSVPSAYNNYDRAAAVARKKAHVQAIRDIEEAPAVKPYRPPPGTRLRALLHQPKYPTATSLRNDIMELNVIKEKVIQENDMEQLLEMMVLEGRLEKMSGASYRLAMKATDVDEGLNGFVDAPCGTCPVFELCADTGEISARTCVYFTEWLSTDTETA